MQFPFPKPKWLDVAFRDIGTAEIHGPKTSPTITKWLQKLKAWWNDDETAWCGTFVAHCLDEAGLMIPKNWMRAKEYIMFGQACNMDSIPFGAICVKTRVGGGHVFFAVARSRDGNTIYGLGGNQGDKVCIEGFKRSDIVAARWPDPKTVRTQLPVAISSADVSAEAQGLSEA